MIFQQTYLWLFFTVSGIRTERAANVNLTSVLQSLFPWKQVIDIELYTNRSKFAYCNSMICKLTEIDSNHPVFWNRLQVIHNSSLLLTEIEKSDDRLEINVQAHIKANNTKVKSRRSIEENMESFRAINLKILVISSQGN